MLHCPLFGALARCTSKTSSPRKTTTPTPTKGRSGYSLKGSTLYCTVEPCSFYGRTPSCAKTIVEKNITHVVLAIRDPHPQVNGEGIRLLKEGGITVTEGIEEQAVIHSLQDWLRGYE